MKMKNYVIFLLFTLCFFGQPINTTDAQKSDTTVPRYADKKTAHDVAEQEVKKQQLFKQAFSNQDTVTLLISKKAKPRVIHTIKRVPIYIPVVNTPQANYILISKVIKDTNSTVKGVTKTLITTQVIPIEEKKAPHRGWLYRIFHKH